MDAAPVVPTPNPGEHQPTAAAAPGVMPPTIAVALQEWAVTCAVLLAGESILLVRKGGIHERAGGLFAADHRESLLLPTALHQQASRLRPDIATRYAEQLKAPLGPPSSVPGIAFPGWMAIAASWRVTDRERLATLAPWLIWTEAEVAARFAYRDQPWLAILAVRAYRFAVPPRLDDHPSYAGCRSWIPLRCAVPTAGSVAVVDDAAYQARLRPIADLLGPSAP